MAKKTAKTYNDQFTYYMVTTEEGSTICSERKLVEVIRSKMSEYSDCKVTLFEGEVEL